MLYHRSQWSKEEQEKKPLAKTVKNSLLFFGGFPFVKGRKNVLRHWLNKKNGSGENEEKQEQITEQPTTWATPTTSKATAATTTNHSVRKTCARPASIPARYQRTQLPSQMPEPLSLCSFSCFFPPSLWIFVIFGDTLQELIAKAASKNVPCSYIYCFSTVSQYFHYSAWKPWGTQLPRQRGYSDLVCE